MATLDEARRISLALPDTSEKTSWGSLHWRVHDQLFSWERPLRKKELAELGDAAPEGEILGVRVADLEEKEALLASEPDVFFTTAHFTDHPSVLVRLAAIGSDELTEVITDAWIARAPVRLRQQFLDDRNLNEG